MATASVTKELYVKHDRGFLSVGTLTLDVQIYDDGKGSVRIKAEDVERAFSEALRTDG